MTFCAKKKKAGARSSSQHGKRQRTHVCCPRLWNQHLAEADPTGESSQVPTPFVTSQRAGIQPTFVCSRMESHFTHVVVLSTDIYGQSSLEMSKLRVFGAILQWVSSIWLQCAGRFRKTAFEAPQRPTVLCHACIRFYSFTAAVKPVFRKLNHQILPWF